jgi:hypothetical protein
LFAQSFVKNFRRNGFSIKELEQRVLDVRCSSGSVALDLKSLWLDE